ncbi:MAG TPA: WbqC family protein [Thermoanaerobaculia bacterium]|nr:WbqC family protein [Thermoanaerobaculia bacterium]
MKRAAILQSCYIPWKGYFDIIGAVDEFILYDDVSYSKNDWRNRNRIKTRTGVIWLTIPVLATGRFGQRIRDVEIGDPRWAAKHWKSIQTHYARARCFGEVAPVLRDLYERAEGEVFLSRVNEMFLRALCDLLGIGTRITSSADYELQGDRTERLVHLCEQAGAREYLSGPAAKSYLDEEKLAARGIAVRFMDYAGYPEYGQLFCPPFVHEVSVIDLLLNEGTQGARRYLRSFGEAMPGGPVLEVVA